MRLFLLLWTTLLLSNFAFSQKTPSELPEDANAKYFEIPRESLYVHLNKSTYVLGDQIWFKGYAYDRKNRLPSLRTKNFNIELFNKEGKEVYSSLHLGEDGKTSGTIKIDSTWSSGNYYLRISTNWMNNFIEDDSYTQKIKIINQKIVKQDITQEIAYDFKLLPEGGHIVSGTDNTIGFKLINDRGYGVSFDEAYIVDQQNTKIISFRSNAFGMGKFTIHPDPEKKYEAIVKLKNGKEVRTTFPSIAPKGISMSINNLFDDSIVIELNTNPNTSKDIEQKEYYLLIRQNGESRKVAVSFLSNQYKKTIHIGRKELFEGVNIITLFKDKTPVLERLLFNSITKINTNEVLITSSKAEKDSLSFTIAIDKKKEIQYDMSISVLPEYTKAYEHDDNIISALMLKNHLKGFVENPKYYFTNVDREKSYDLDLLLITQGWSKYSWHNIFTYQPKIRYDFNYGITVKGKLQNTRDHDIDKIYLFPTKHSASKIIDLDSTRNSFVITDFYPEKNEIVKLSAIKSNGRFAKTGVYLQVQPNRFKKSFSATIPSKIDVNNIVLDDVDIPDYFFNSEIQKLDKVEISAVKKQENLSNIFIPDYVKKRSKEITEQDARSYPNVLDYISTKGFRVRYGSSENGNAVSTTPQGEVTIISTRLVSALGSNSPQVFLDGVLLSNYDILFNFRTEEVERIFIDRTGSITGLRGAGTIEIYTRKIPLGGYKTGSKVRSTVSKHKIKDGFEPKKEFYNPEYSSFSDPLFIDYGTIHWQPEITFNKKGKSTFKIPDTSLKNIKFFIEGIGSDGSLVSKVYTVRNVNAN
ncbi:hypothetical protein D1816_16320 [Aquimarina sp. AD10]|uniref:hypothetical protein n=1 Tax=Aquimarina sp. AD10 TaxID=1714849 RepID=UPI000E4843D5|nr:hypothetical protein [Aquimarina sp. AD10]AXT61855.1 hypothetical protein D1816_16320 [Aquimarina sp. AD10]RKN02651.1 hypothetical protein D7033_00435 [Aquimarina sp. AD10]